MCFFWFCEDVRSTLWKLMTLRNQQAISTLQIHRLFTDVLQIIASALQWAATLLLKTHLMENVSLEKTSKNVRGYASMITFLICTQRSPARMHIFQNMRGKPMEINSLLANPRCWRKGTINTKTKQQPIRLTTNKYKCDVFFYTDFQSCFMICMIWQRSRSTPKLCTNQKSRFYCRRAAKIEVLHVL